MTAGIFQKPAGNSVIGGHSLQFPGGEQIPDLVTPGLPGHETLSCVLSGSARRGPDRYAAPRPVPTRNDNLAHTRRTTSGARRRFRTVRALTPGTCATSDAARHDHGAQPRMGLVGRFAGLCRYCWRPTG